MKIAEKRNVPRRKVEPAEKVRAQIFTDTMHRLVGPVADISTEGLMLIFTSDEFINLDEFKEHFIEPSTTLEIQMHSGEYRFILSARIRWIGELEREDDNLRYALGIQFKDERELTPNFIRLVGSD